MDPLIGQIQLFAFNYVPENWVLCDGRTFLIGEYQALFSLLRTSYGGDGQTDFALPNMVGMEPIPGTRYCICVQGLFPTRM